MTSQHNSVMFIPLKADYFRAFVSLLKKTEYRPYNQRWNEVTCWVGRRVLLSLGYGKQYRVCGRVVGFEKSQIPCYSAEWVACYGQKVVDVACIKIEILGPPCTRCFGTGRHCDGPQCSTCKGSGQAVTDAA